ncbi:MAG: adenylate cyclase [Candidatus Saccharibacteria bacterium]|nr:adenylate cyclase [Candidatus Saccharibacteria bacterium]
MSVPEYQEIECKFLDVNPKQLGQTITNLGGKRQFRKLFRRYVFDFPDKRLNAQASWLRIRDEGDKSTLTFKQRIKGHSDTKDAGMKEIEVTVSDFIATADVLKAIGMTPKFYEENWRTLYTLNGVEVAIDEWPLIPPYVEIEGDSWKVVDDAASVLGFDPKQKLICATMQVYEHYGINENDYQILTLDKQIKK